MSTRGDDVELMSRLRDFVDKHGTVGVREVASELEKICAEKSVGLTKAKKKDPTSPETETLQRWANLRSRLSW